MENYFTKFFSSKEEKDDEGEGAYARLGTDSTDGTNDKEIKSIKTKFKSKSSDEIFLFTKKQNLCDIKAKIRYDNILSQIYSRKKVDLRVRVNQPLKWPYSAIGALFIKFNNDYWLGTGTLISERIVMTAAHNIFVKNEFEGSEIKFYPGINNNQVVSNTITKVQKVFLPKEYIEDSNSSEDYALIVLEKPLGEYFGYFGLNILDQSNLNTSSKEFFLYGYPGDKIRDKPGNYEMWGMKLDNVKIHTDGYISYTVDSYSGMSGAAVWYMGTSENNYKNCYLIGVHVAHNVDKREGYAVHINEKRYETILKQVNSL